MVEAQLYIDGKIVSQIPCDENGLPLPGPFALLSGLQSQLEWQRPYDTIRVQINSPGGETTQGFAMGDWLRSLNVPITTVAIGQCSSIATAPFLAGSTRLVHRNTEMLIHLPTGGFQGTGANAAQSFANDMADCESKIIALYVERTGGDASEIAALMAKETTLTADMARDMGFATQVLEPIMALAVLPTPNPSSNPSLTPADPDTTLMSKFNNFLNRMKTALSELEKDAPKTALAVTTTGDSPVELTIDSGDRTAYEVGDMVYSDAEMTSAAADGDYVLTDGNTITVAEGAISAITEPNTDSAADGDVAQALQSLAESMVVLTNEVRSMKTSNATQAQSLATVKAQYTALARGVKTNAAASPAGKSGADDDTDDADPMKVAAANRAERRKNRYAKS
ncbi:Clp protease ClpP [Hymenobacter lapidiphilus]|uniref:Clp protease ClpP n=1 Tax=Hymenobacter sp. CCM 8763 TaxID=2303334 RepID=UPI000E344CB9|nr:Clp protease ClpP [Hymenobacter sp. CCM 8763]RFP65933.1 Clp protease ClpP [Hymenobacter sp. CCM 8763]